jgi:hypothetical protein
LLAQKTNQKRAPLCPGLSDSLALLVVVGTLKTRLRLKQVQRLIPTTTAMLSGTEWGFKKLKIIYFVKCHFTQPSSETKKEIAFWRSTPQGGINFATSRNALSFDSFSLHPKGHKGKQRK